MERIYLDHNATTPLDPRVATAMRPWLEEHYGNPSSLHAFGRAAREAVETARDQVAALLGGRAAEVVFTASGTESNNAVLGSVAQAAGFEGHLVLSGFEHPSVRLCGQRLAGGGLEVTAVQPAADGVVPADAFVEALRPDTRLVSLMAANNEVGTLQPVEVVAAACSRQGIPVHCDAAQAVGKVPVSVEELGVDYLTLGAHKFHGPPGVAALWIRKGAPFEGFLVGGSQERRRRAGTENVPGVVGLGLACELARRELDERQVLLARLRDRFEAGLAAIPDVKVHCADAPRLPHTSHIAVLGVEGEALLIRLDLAGCAVSTGSACSSGVPEPSKTLLAMGMSPEEALASLRISFGITNTEAEVDAFLGILAREAAELRRLSPVAARGAAAR